MWWSVRVTGPKLPKMQCNMGHGSNQKSRIPVPPRILLARASPGCTAIRCWPRPLQQRHQEDPPASSTQVVAAKPLWPHERGLSVRSLQNKVPVRDKLVFQDVLLACCFWLLQCEAVSFGVVDICRANAAQRRISSCQTAAGQTLRKRVFESVSWFWQRVRPQPLLIVETNNSQSCSDVKLHKRNYSRPQGVSFMDCSISGSFGAYDHLKDGFGLTLISKSYPKWIKKRSRGLRITGLCKLHAPRQPLKSYHLTGKVVFPPHGSGAMWNVRGLIKCFHSVQKFALWFQVSPIIDTISGSFVTSVQTHASCVKIIC